MYFDDNCDWDFDKGAPSGREVNVWLGMPELTPHIMAYYYDASIRGSAGRLDAVFNIENVPPAVLSSLIRDLEMSQSDVMEPNPWQTDACIGAWHYRRSIYENHRYRTSRAMIHLLVDVVSKNGNLLLNVPLPGHGRPDDDELAFLDRVAAWMALNGEAVYDTRPWKTYGEGRTKGGGSLYGGRAARNLWRATSGSPPREIRYTR